MKRRRLLRWAEQIGLLPDIPAPETVDPDFDEDTTELELIEIARFKRKQEESPDE